MKENNPHILGTEKVGKLLLEYSIPAIIGMTLTSLYNIIDSVFIGHGVGAMAISGLAISFPLMNLLVAFCRSEERRVGKECRSRWSADH